MPTKHNDQDYKKDEWRARNITYARRHLRREDSFLWVEAFGRSGPTSMKTVVDSKVIPGEDHFFGIDNSPEVFWNYYRNGNQEEAGVLQERLKNPRLRYGHIHSQLVPLSTLDIAPIGVFNLDLLGLVGHANHWHSSYVGALRTAVENSLERLNSCVLIFNHAACMPKHGTLKEIGIAVRNQYAHIKSFVERTPGVTSTFLKSPVPEPEVHSAKEFANLRRGKHISSGPWEYYKSHNKTLPMVTTRIVITRKNKRNA